MQIVKVTQIKNNPRNPRIIKDEQFKKLVQSIIDFPDMLNKRPLICFTDVDKKYVVLGGNMRLKASMEAGLKEVPIMLADDWTEEQKREFIIKDNVGFGEWNWDDLHNEWDMKQLESWGLDTQGFGISDNGLGDEFTLPDGDKSPFQQMTFTMGDEQAEYLKNLLSEIKQSESFKYVETFGNENSNGNALYLMAREWEEQKK